MLRIENCQTTIWDAVLPPELLELNEELAKVDALLDDEKFLAPFIARFNTKIGRPTIPVETYLRMMYLKTRYQLGYETLVEEVSDSIKWRRFCRIPVDKKVPHSTTLIKLTKRYGPETIDELNSTLIQKAREERIIKSRKLRLDTTVVEADIHHPTDADLLSDGVRVITRTVKKIIRTVESIKVQFRDRTRSVKKRILLISKILKQRSGDSYQKVREITGEIIDITQQVIKQAQQVAKNVTQQIICQDVDIPNKVCSAVQTLENFIVLTERVITQTAEVQQGNFHIPGRIISIFAPDDRPIRRGKLHAPTEFGRKLLLTETEERIITDYRVLDGNPKDDTLLVPAVDRFIETFGRPPWGVATDRGFSSAKNELIMKQRGVKRCSLPRKGKLSESRKKFQSQSWFKRLQHWRAGGEATISVLKRKYGLKCSRFRGDRGTKTWVGLGILAYNVRRIATLM